MSYAANVHVAVYQVLDDVLGSISAPPPGANGEIHSVIDVLRSASAPSDLIALAEAISLRLHKLESAFRYKDQASQQESREALKAIAAEWLSFRIVN